MPVASTSRSAFCGARSLRSGSPGVPALRIDWMRLPETTMSTGPTGGAPEPSMRMAPRMTSVE